MGYFDILMKPNKMLIATHQIRLKQFDSLVDKIRFSVPFNYSEEIDLRDFSVTFEWLDPSNVVHSDVLVKEEELYKENYQRYFLPVTCTLNRYPGDIEGKLVFIKVDYEERKVYKLETDTTIIPIYSIKDFYVCIPDESLNALDQRIAELQTQTDALIAAAEVYEKTKADNLTLDQVTNQLQLTANGELIGDPVVIDLIDEDDKELEKLDKNPHDGVIDLDDIDFDEVTL